MQVQSSLFGVGGKVLLACQSPLRVSTGHALALLLGLYDAESTPVGSALTMWLEYVEKSGRLVALSSEPIDTRPDVY